MQRAEQTVTLLTKGDSLPRASSSPLSRIPPELWECIFESYDEEKDPETDVQKPHFSNIRLTCRTFASVSKSVAFRHFIFRPFVCQESSDTPHLFFPKGYDVPRGSARLQAWGSFAIAQHVRRVSIEPASWDGPYSKEGDGEHLLDAFFRVLPRFSGAVRVDCAGFPFDEYRLAQLGRLSRLRFLSMQKCMIAVDVTQLPPGMLKQIATFDYNTGYTGNFDSEYHRRTTKWLAVIQREMISNIQLSLFHPFSVTEFFRSLTASGMAHLLTSLEIPEDHELVKLLVATLAGGSGPPSLRKLSLLVRRGVPHSPIVDAEFCPMLGLPELQEYTGSAHFLVEPVFVPHAPSIKRLQLYSEFSYRMHAPDYIVLTLHRLSNSASSDLGLGLSGLTRLRFDAGYLPADLLVAISECCPELKELYVLARDESLGGRRTQYGLFEKAVENLANILLSGNPGAVLTKNSTSAPTEPADLRNILRLLSCRETQHNYMDRPRQAPLVPNNGQSEGPSPEV
ncbi:hypothetical protein HWV62_41398 [Athelia sp. TMB]|nr:hypothetical protein HWV62_41398 [Athelia sp. TMB]